ncbi:hypothetical protein [Bacillus litorisediminis]|uniref:hypothetical protein n=1 Tax=Bacillus litorisediminis TaxID=2922713 RepID=UPI001FAEB021|nr:hypothetical protein [Bacillus litorisediminis]
MENLIHTAVSAVGLILLVFLLPVRWSLFGRVVIWFVSSLAGGLLILAWGHLPKLQTILLHIGLTISMSILILKWWGEHFYKKAVQQKRGAADLPQPLFSYQKQLDKAKLAKPANLVQVDSESASINVIDSQASIQAEGQIKPTANMKNGSNTKNELQYLLSDEKLDYEMPGFRWDDDSTAEDEPGYLLDDWIMSDDWNKSHKKEEAAEKLQNESQTKTIENVISFDEKRKERENLALALEADREPHKDIIHTSDQVADENKIESKPFENIENVHQFNQTVEQFDLKWVSLPENLEAETRDDIEEEEFASSYPGRSMLLNDGIANLYKEQAESVKKQKTTYEDDTPVLQNEKLFLKELSKRFRASSE